MAVLHSAYTLHLPLLHPSSSLPLHEPTPTPYHPNDATPPPHYISTDHAPPSFLAIDHTSPSLNLPSHAPNYGSTIPSYSLLFTTFFSLILLLLSPFTHLTPFPFNFSISYLTTTSSIRIRILQISLLTNTLTEPHLKFVITS